MNLKKLHNSDVYSPSGGGGAISIYIIDDHSIVVEGILSLLQNDAEIAVCGCSNTAAACINFFENN